MRIALCLSISLLLAGCASEDAPAEVPETPAVEGNLTVPEPLHWAGALKAVAEPAQGTTTGCQLDDGCAVHTFDVAANLSAEIVLKSIDGTVTGTTAPVTGGSDYDMTLRDAAGKELGVSTNPGAEDDVISVSLGPGTYSIEVLAWNDQDGSYDLTVTFAA